MSIFFDFFLKDFILDLIYFIFWKYYKYIYDAIWHLRIYFFGVIFTSHEFLRWVKKPLIFGKKRQFFFSRRNFFLFRNQFQCGLFRAIEHIKNYLWQKFEGISSGRSRDYLTTSFQKIEKSNFIKDSFKDFLKSLLRILSIGDFEVDFFWIFQFCGHVISKSTRRNSFKFLSEMSGNVF